MAPEGCREKSVECWEESVECWVDPVRCWVDPVKCWVEPEECCGTAQSAERVRTVLGGSCRVREHLGDCPEFRVWSALNVDACGRCGKPRSGRFSKVLW